MQRKGLKLPDLEKLKENMLLKIIFWQKNQKKENSKKGHDFALRVFVIKSTGKLPWKKKVINYVFSSNEIKQSSWTSPYTKQSVDYVLSSLKDDKQNKWISVKTNVKEDFQTIHKLNVNKIDGIAIMTDTDNSKQEAIGYYKDIYFSSK